MISPWCTPALAPGPCRLDLHHHDASSAALDRDKLEAKAEITPRDVPVLLKPRRDALDGSRRDDEDASARPEHRHANRPARRVNGKPAFGTLPHAQIKLDPSVDLTTRRDHQGPVTAGHHAKCRGWRTIFGAHRYSKRADSVRAVPQAEPAAASERSTRNSAMSVV